MTITQQESPMSPARPRRAAMTPRQLKLLLKRNECSQVEAAKRLGINLRTFTRWASGYTPISEANALLITLKIGR